MLDAKNVVFLYETITIQKILISTVDTDGVVFEHQGTGF